jgi:NAD(P)H dehydrogenase (quinone)
LQPLFATLRAPRETRTDQRILVTGATGETGQYTTELLIKQGFSVRALAHKKDERSEKLRATGAEVVGGDLRDFDAVRQALKGVGRTYFVYPIRPGLIDATAYFAQASREARLDGIVNMSQISARENSKNHAARDH